MPTKVLPLTDGGPVFHPDRPAVFHPSLRAAAHLLLIGHRLETALLRDLEEELLPLHPATPCLILSSRLRFGVDGVEWRGPQTRHEAHRSAHRYLDGLLRWAAERHLRSPYVLEILGLTLMARHTAERLARLEGSSPPRKAGAERARRASLPGPWIEALTTEPADVDLAPLVRLTPHVRLVQRPTRRVPRFRAAPMAWNPELEPFEDFRRRLQRQVSADARRYRDTVLQAAEAQGCIPLRLRPTEEHLTWLARRQLQGWRPAEIARRYRVGVSTVHDALSALSELLKLPLRPVKGGRPEL